MRLVITRHGKAESGSESGSDFDRVLRPRGERQAAYLAQSLATMEPPVERVIASRAARARQTAELIADGLGVDLEFDERLLVDEPTSPVMDLLRERAEAACLVLVGHNPQLEHLVAVLRGGPTASVQHIRTGEAVVLEVEPLEPLESGAELGRIRMPKEG